MFFDGFSVGACVGASSHSPGPPPPPLFICRDGAKIFSEAGLFFFIDATTASGTVLSLFGKLKDRPVT